MMAVGMPKAKTKGKSAGIKTLALKVSQQRKRQFLRL
jgi:hypothetical protein